MKRFSHYKRWNKYLKLHSMHCDLSWPLECWYSNTQISSRNRIFLAKLIYLHLVTKCPASCGTRKFINAFTRACHLSLSWARLIPAMHAPSHFLKVNFINILPSSSRSFKWFLSLRPPHQDPTRTLSLPRKCYMHHYLLFFLIWLPE